MEIKKTPKASLENKKLLFREIGLIAALIVVFFAFEWKTYDKEISTLDTSSVMAAEEEMIPITTTAPEKLPEQPKQPVLSDFIDIVSDDVVIEDDIVINTEDDGAMDIEIKDYIEEAEVVEEVIEEEIPFARVEEKPSFMGKNPATEFRKWVNKNLVYPEIAAEMGVQGRVYLSFIVDIDGQIKDIKVLRGVDDSLNKEAVRVVKKSPKWTPGKQRNKPVKVRYTFFVDFQLR